MVIQLPVALDDGAAVNAVITATEAKTQALTEAGVDGTGTATDAVKPGLDVTGETAGLLAALTSREAPTVLVSDEVGMAVHPPTDAGRHYVEAVGALNQRVAAVADRVLLVVAGRALELPPSR